MPDELDGLHAATKGGGKLMGRGRFQCKQRMKAQEQRAKAAEVAAREQAEHDDAAASTHERSAGELTALQTEVERLEKEINKVKKHAHSLAYKIESGRERSRNQDIRGKELRAAAVESDIAHTTNSHHERCNPRDSLGPTIR
jgi:predicted RNase H-like nuclease (RuvC/YqgF family)